MDRMTASICEKPYGRATFARVLVEIDSEIPLVGFVKLWYESLGKVLRLRVEHDWVPPRCEECKVFGHYLSDYQNKVNMARKVNKDGENMKPSEVKNGNNGTVSGNVNVDEGWTTAGNRRNRGGGNNLRQGNFGGYQTRRGVYVNTASGNNTSNVNTGNKGNKEVSKKSEPVKSGNIGSVDDSVVMNDKGVPANKGKGKVDEGISGGDGNRNSGNNDNKKNEQKKNLGNKSSNKNGNVSKSGDGRNPKDVLGSKNVSTSNRFDALGSEQDSDSSEIWNDVKSQVIKACDSGIPILEGVVKGLNDDMIKPVGLCVNWVCWFCSGTGFWRCNFVFERGEDLDYFFVHASGAVSDALVMLSVGSYLDELCLDLYYLDYFFVHASGAVSDALVMLSVGSYLDELCLDLYCFTVSYYFFPVFKLSIFAFYGLYVYGDVWNSIGKRDLS
ncbi:hypothetical protein CTI12_AA309100 [Artemisia annua]|uniref:Zinc knuckle CX2CX4HX4C n=1 Tax=Artemisia annua TaxID=35608 RepID=A0A2U1MPU6_ARTAN|nr:hypothetical protein CTI12_AA309100 [Artemisia annua]